LAEEYIQTISYQFLAKEHIYSQPLGLY